MTSNPDKEDNLVKKLKRQVSNASLTKVIILLAVLTLAVYVAIILMLVEGLVLSGSKAGDPVEEIFGPFNYLVNTTNCFIPRFHPYREDIHIFKYSKAGSCGSLPLLSSVSRYGETVMLHLNMSSYAASNEEVTCCYSYIVPSGVIDEPIFGNCIEFTDTADLDPDFDFVRVACGTSNSSEKPPTNVYHHFHSYVSFKQEVRSKMERYNESIRKPPSEKPWSVMIVGIESLSRFNLKRRLPSTAKYLDGNWFSVEGYSKVGDDVFPNIAAFLAGSTEEQLNESCIIDSFVDSCPWIWRRFSSQGYITAYGEDFTEDDEFHLKTRGFGHQPPDYFLRTSLKAAQNRTQDFNCMGKIHAHEHVMKFSLEFAEVLKYYPTFSIFWLNPSTLLGSKDIDFGIRSYLQNLTRLETVLIFMSDHGISHLNLQKDRCFTKTNLPFLYFWLPESFKKLNPKAVKNVIENKSKLTSHFDLHLTLLDLLNDGSTAPGCPTCSSLFKPIPPTRTCADAGIPSTHCPCMEYSEISNTSSLYHDLGKFLVERLNFILAQLQKDVLEPKNKCTNFTLERTLSVKRVLPKLFGVSAEENGGTAYQFIISIETQPKAVMEALVDSMNNSVRIIDSLLKPASNDTRTRCFDYLTYPQELVKSSFS